VYVKIGIVLLFSINFYAGAIQQECKNGWLCLQCKHKYTLYNEYNFSLQQIPTCKEVFV
jgi:hypothetical protein